jgi:cell division septation protein DedD
MGEVLSENLGSTHVSAGHDRRLHPRQSVLLSCIQLEDDNGGIVLNVCEKGLAMQVVRSLGDNRFPKLRFQLSLSNTWIEARGRIAWLSNSRNTAGVELVEITDEARQLLKKSIAAFSDAEDTENVAAADDLALVQPARSAAVDTTAIAIGETENTPSGELVESSENGPSDLDWAKIGVQLDMETTAHEAAPPDSAGGQDTHTPSETFSASGGGLTLFSEKERAHRNESGGGSSGSRSRMILFVAVAFVILGIAALYLRHASGPKNGPMVAENGTSTSKATPESPAAQTPPGSSSAPESPARAAKSTPIAPASSTHPVSTKGALPKAAPVLKAPALPDKLPATAAAAPSKTIFSANSGFVLQVGAMKNQDNAVSLAGLLREKNFPAFVVKPASDPLYRVMVGPYSDAKSAAGGESELRKQGFQAIRKPNTPAQ